MVTNNTTTTLTINDKTLDHVLVTLLNIPRDSDTYKCIKNNGYTTAYEFIGMTEQTIDELVYDVTDANGTIIQHNKQLPRCHRSRLSNLHHFFEMMKRKKNGKYISEDDILDTTVDEWNQFCISFSRSCTTCTKIDTYEINVHEELIRFRNSIERDMTQYKEIKDDRDFDNWQRSFLSLAACHQISEVFDPNYVPISDDEIELFKLQQTFAYCVLVRVLQTDMGQTIVRKYDDTMDAQKIWKEFVTDAKFSTRAKIFAGEILSWITTAKYDRTWKGTCHCFLLYWMNKLREYETFGTTSTKTCFSDRQKKSMIRNTVSDISDFQQVFIREEMESIRGGNTLTYEQYTNLLLSVAQSYDHSNKLKKNYSDDQQYNIDTYLSIVTNRERDYNY